MLLLYLHGPLRSSLSSREHEEIMLERGLHVDHTELCEIRALRFQLLNLLPGLGKTVLSFFLPE